jgi:hypothetical protein
MLGAEENKSEVAQLLAQISAEYEAAQRGLSGLSYGVAQHTFIDQKQTTIGQLHNQLHTLVGDDAIRLMSNALDQLP